MTKYTIDQGALESFLESTLKEYLQSEETCKKNGSYELAISYREQRYLIGNLLLMIKGDRHQPPCTVDKGGFMKPLTNIRAAVNAMTDEELAETLSPIFMMTAEGKLVDCAGSWCTRCPAYDLGESCKEGIKEYMLQEVE